MKTLILEKEDIMNIIPHRKPMLFADRASVILDSEGHVERCQTEFDVPADWEIFKGHFQEEPIMPGVLILEAMAQCADLLILYSKAENALPLLSGVRSVRFFRPVRPGDTLMLTAQIRESALTTYECYVVAELAGNKAAQGTITITLK